MSANDIPLGDVLSVTTGSLVSRDHIGGVYRVCDFMTGVPNMTHQLGRVSEQIRPVIFAQHPWLAAIEAPAWDFPEGATQDECAAIVYGWLGQMEELHGATVSLVPLASYDAPNPIEELCDMVGAEKVYVASAGRPSGSDGNGTGE